MPAFSSSKPSAADGTQQNCQSSEKGTVDLNVPDVEVSCPIGSIFTGKVTSKGVFMIVVNIQASPRGSKSISTAATDAFVEAYRTAHPDVTIDKLNVWDEGLPEFDSEAIGAKYKGGL